MNITRSTGDVELDNCDGKSISIETNTGDIKGSLKTPKIFETKTSTGKIEVPESSEGGTCTLTTSTGNITIGLS